MKIYPQQRRNLAQTVLPGLVSVLMLVPAVPARAAFSIAKGGKAQCVIVQQPGATIAESNAVRELTGTLEKITGATFEVQTAADGSAPERAIIVGPGVAARALFPEVALDKLGAEELAMKVKGNRLLLAGGRPRGTVYAVNRFLQEQCGARWWMPWAASIPARRSLRVPDLDVRYRPPFEYREPFWYAGFEPQWKVRNGANGENRRIPAELGGCILYKGFCHTFYPLVPPDKHFAAHPEWYSLIKGKRTHEHAQLCLSNPELRDFVVSRVKEWLREAPEAQIISVTQNDCHGACECASCTAIDEAQGSPSGSMLAFVNYVAERIEPEFPHVAVDTFAYQYTRKPPKTIQPRPNVIVRLCSIECNFREPLDHASNAAFLADLEGWSKICRRLYVWDYTTDFSHYVLPHPNWFVLGANVRLFEAYNVKGLFEQGAYQGYGSEMAELRGWVLAQLLWNPRQDERALIKEFLEGYYGKRAGGLLGRYLVLMHDASKGFNLRCYLGNDPPHLRFQPLAAAERLWQQAEAAASREADPDILLRVRMGHLPVRFACLERWTSLRRECWEQNGTWPWPRSRKAAAEEFRRVCAGVPGKDWTVVKVLNEPGLQVDTFLQGVAADVPDANGPPPPKRLLRAPPPEDLRGMKLRHCVDLQDNVAGLHKPGEFAEIRPDAAASDRRAAWMPGKHKEWAFRIPGKALPLKARTGKWKVYAVVRVEREPGVTSHGIAFGAGVYDNQTRTYPADLKVLLNETVAGYRSYLVGTVENNVNRDIWVAPAGNKAVKAIYVDRIFLTPE
ncbi:MAG TPA: DUF4838 domain-containing protein [Candidatus Paceibacterota bacterium]|nr:DUF4838 domain-containing protein [Verrucomicrobiota bacterium]HSA11155.1 DUF4838 domain-containing protein [Candidatus Paceibacterota bacterium]